MKKAIAFILACSLFLSGCSNYIANGQAALEADGYTNIEHLHNWGVYHCSDNDGVGIVFRATKNGRTQDVVYCSGWFLKGGTIRILRTYPQNFNN